jgi:ribosome-binding factor A
MSVDRLERVDSLLKRVIADAMFRIMQSDEIGAGLITVTGVQCARNLRNATVKVSVFGEPDVQQRALGHIIHHTHDFERVINREVRMKFTPQLRFELDHSIEKGDAVLAILDKLPGAKADGESG